MEGIKQLATAKRRAVLNLPFYSLGEEIWNAVSHGIGAGYVSYTHLFCMNLLFLYVKIFPLQVEWEK